MHANSMLIMTFSAMIDADPVPSFIADHPFIAAVVADNTIYFTATYNGK